MLQTSLIVVSAVLAVCCAVLKKAYQQTGKNQDFSPKIPANSQRALRFIADNKQLTGALLSAYLALFLSLVAVLAQRQIGLWSIIISFLLIVLVLLVLPATKISKLSNRLAAAVAPAIRLMVEKAKPLANTIEKAVPARFRQSQADTGVYTRSDLEEFLKRQKHSAGNFISDVDLNNLLRRLDFDNKKVRGCMQAKKKSTTVGASEAIGPVLINDLHQSGQQYFLVEEEFNNEIIGTLDVAELIDLKKTGDVKSTMNDRLFYLRDKWTLLDAFEAFSKTGSPVFVVVNGDEDIKGIVSIKDILTELLGDQPMSGFGLFDQLQSVAETSLEDERSAE